MMKGRQKTKLRITSRIYEIVRKEYRKARSEIMKNRIVSDETRKKLSAINRGRIQSEETRKKISKANKGKLIGFKRSKEFCEKISKSLLGHKKTTDWINKINKNPVKIAKTADKHRGMKRSKISKERMSLAKLGKTPFNFGKKYYYNPETHEKILCFPGQETKGFINGIEKSKNKSHGILGGKFYYNNKLDKEICLHANEMPPEGYIRGRRRWIKK